MEKGIATCSKILVGRNPCSLPLVPAGTLIWGCEDFSEFSGDELSCEDAPQSGAHCGLSQYPRFWAPWEPSLTNSAGRVQGPGWFKALVGSRTRASSCCRVPLSFNELMPVELLELPPFSKQRHQDFPWRLTSELPPPQLGDPAHPQLTASHSQHRPESSLQVEKPHPPPESRAYRFCFYFSLQGDFRLLDIKVDVNCVICMKLNMTYVNVEWPILSDLVFVTGCDVMCFPFP